MVNECNPFGESFTGQLRLEGTFGDHLVQAPPQVAEDHVQTALEYLQGWRLHNLSGQPVPVCSYPSQLWVVLVCLFSIKSVFLCFPAGQFPLVHGLVPPQGGESHLIVLFTHW